MPAERSAVYAAKYFNQYPLRTFFRRLYNLHHTRRFEWLQGKIASLGKRELSILELGCNDARSLDYVPVPVKRYVGLDAGWRSGWKDGKACGLEAAILRYGGRPNYEFRRSQRCEDLEQVSGKFDLAIVLETFEYLEPTAMVDYVNALSRKLHDHGSILSTMPNEKGVPLLVKTVGSRLSGVPRSGYTPRQFWNALIGRMDKVPRGLRGRRGFDYAATAELIGRYFSRTELDSVEPARAPLWLSLNVGLAAHKGEAAAPTAPELPSTSKPGGG